MVVQSGQIVNFAAPQERALEVADPRLAQRIGESRECGKGGIRWYGILFTKNSMEKEGSDGMEKEGSDGVAVWAVFGILELLGLDDQTVKDTGIR